ncbi:MAG: aminotransferase, partial [Eubacteriales bacterium]|nr:aminotransferase [Eubacteriales bacterium]
NLPGVSVIDSEGTYLMWLDFRGTGLDAAELDRRIIHEAKLWLDSGEIFGEAGKGFQRINVAAPRKIITECMERMKAVLVVHDGVQR